MSIAPLTSPRRSAPRAGRSPWTALWRRVAIVLVATMAVLGLSLPAQAAEGVGDVSKALDTTQGAGFTAPNTFQSGALVRYRLTLSCSSNVGDCGPTTLTDTLAPGLVPVNAVLPTVTQSDGTRLPLSSSISGQNLVVTVGNTTTPWLDGNTFEVIVVARVTGTVTGKIPNQATLQTAGGTVQSPIVEIVVPTPTPSWGIDKRGGGQIVPGEFVNFRIGFTVPSNLGNVNVTGGTLVDTFPAGAIVYNGTTPVADGGTTTNGGVVDYDTHTITWTVPRLDAANSNCNTSPCNNTSWGPFVVRMQFPADAFTGSAPVVNTVSADLTYANGTSGTVGDTDTVSFVTAVPSLSSIDKTGPSTAVAGERISYGLRADNNGNTTLTNVVLVDTLPTSGLTDLVLIQNFGPAYTGPSGATYEYSTDGGATWQPLYRYEIGATWVNTPIPAGATHVRMTVDTLAPAMSARFGIQATVAADIASGTVLTNCAETTTTGTTSTRDCQATTVAAPFSQLKFAKGTIYPDAAVTSIRPGEEARQWLSTRKTSGSPLTTIDFIDVLPAGIEYVSTRCFFQSVDVSGSDGGFANPTQSNVTCDTTQTASPEPEITKNADGTTTLRWLGIVPPADVQAGKRYYGVDYTVRALPGTSVGNYTNTAWVNNADFPTTCQTNLGTPTTDTGDMDGDGNVTENFCKVTADLQVRAAAMAEVYKWVKGDLGRNALEATGMPSATCPNLNGYTRYPCVAEVTRGGTFDYLFQNVNLGNVELTDYTMYDILPHTGDVGVNQVLSGSQRGTDWTPVLTGPVALNAATVPAGANPVIYYNYSYDPCRPELSQGTPNVNWQGANCADPVGGTNAQNTWYTQAQVTDWSLVKSFKIVMFDGVRDFTTAWQAGDIIEATAPMKAPAGTPESQLSPLDLSVAWNSVAHQEARLSAGTAGPTTEELLSAAPRKVGIIVPFPGVSVGDYVWLDTNRDGLQSPGEAPVAGVTVNLKDSSGGVISTTTTDADGYYSFRYLLPSTQYTVEFVAPTGLTFTTPNASGITSNDPVADNGTTPLDGTTGGDSDATPSADGTTGSVTFTTPAKDGTSNLASSLSARTLADNPGLDAGFVSTMNLKLAKKLETAGPFFRGKTVTYTLTPSNDGPMDALAGWSVTDLVPAGMTITNMTGTGYTFDIAGGKATSTVSLKAASSAAPITVTATINADAALGSTQKNVAYVAPKDGDIAETVPLAVPDLTTDTTASTTDNDAQAELTLSNAVSIGDYVWYDINRDGIQGSTEPVVEDGMVVNLYAAGAPAGAAPLKSTTTTGGYYAFTDLTPSTAYVVEFVKPAGTSFTTQTVTTATTAGATTANDSNPDVTTGRATVTTPASGSNLGTPGDADDPTIDAGLVKYNLTLDKALSTSGTINPGQDVTFTLTPHNDGPVDALAGWTVTEVLPANLTLKSMTGAGYTYSGNVATATGTLPAGQDGPTITVVATVSSTFTTGTLRNVAYVDKAPGDVAETNPLGSPTPAGTDTAATGTDNDDHVDISVTPLVSIGDFVWYDNNRDGIQNNGEPVYAGMTVNLLNSAGTVVATTQTNANGYYVFANLPPSTTYSVQFVKAAGESFTTQNASGSTSVNDSNPVVTTGLATVTTPADGLNRTGDGLADDPSIDAGVVRYNLVLAKELTSTGSVYAGSTVTFELSPSNEGPATALTGWTVTEVLPKGLTLVEMTGDGYTFDGNVATATAPLAGGATAPKITVTATVNAGFVGDAKNVAYVNKSPDDVAETNPLGTPLPTNSTDTATSPTDNDAEAPLTVDSLVSMGDHVWWDTNRNGVQDATEAPVAGVTVTLHKADGTTVGTPATTDANGFYSFVDLTPGAGYYVVFTPPAGATFTGQNIGANDAIDSDAAVTTGRADFTAPASGSNSATAPDNPTVDAGLVRMNLVLAKRLETAAPFGVGDTVTFTLTPSNNGEVDALAGWSVTDILPKGLTLVELTGDTDVYTFNGATATAKVALAAGTSAAPITVTATIDANTIGTLHNVAYVSPASADIAETNPLVIPSTGTKTGETPTDNDAEAELTLVPVSIGDHVWWDVNRDGLQSDGEAPVAGVTVTLYQADGTTKVGQSSTTDAKGFYSFTGLAPGQDYIVFFTKPDGTTFTTPLAGDASKDSNPNAAGVAPVHTPKTGANSATTPDNPTIDAGLVKINLVLTKKLVTMGPFGSGDTVEFTLVPSNDGPVDALTGWTVTDLLPEGLTLVDMTGDTKAYKCDNLTATCTSLVPLAAGKEAAPITVTATIDAYTTGTLHNVAWVAPVAGDTPETNVLVIPGTGTDTEGTPTDNDAQASLKLLPVSLGDFVWWDVNRDGLQDSGEPAVKDVTVTLFKADGTTKVASTTTDDKGFYSFVDLAPGQAYVVVFTKPDGTSFTIQKSGKDIEVDSNADVATGAADVVMPKTGQNSRTAPDQPTIDAGLVKINLTLDKVLASKGSFHPGDVVSFTLIPHNDGPVDALAGWSVTDLLPEGLSLVSMSGAGYSCDLGTATCASSTPLAAGADGGLISVTAKITASGSGRLRNVAFIAPASGDTSETNPLGPTPKRGIETDSTPTDNDADAALDYTTVPPVSLAFTGASGLGWVAGGGVVLTLLGLLVAWAARRREEELTSVR